MKNGNGTQMGLNRSGMATAPRMGAQALEVMSMTPRTSGDATEIAGERISYSKKAEPVSTMPPPGSV
jgi:hypothetical protein